jgi:probable HAF family extracellular repeat protein
VEAAAASFMPVDQPQRVCSIEVVPGQHKTIIFMTRNSSCPSINAGHRPIWFSWQFLLSALLSCAPQSRLSATSPAYTVTDISQYFSGATTFVGGLNNLGQVAGWYASQNGSQAFLYSGGGVTPLASPDGNGSYGTAINNQGQVVGNFYVGSHSADTHAFFYSGGQMRDLGTLGGANSFANAVNDAGHVVGIAAGTSGGPQGFFYAGGAMQDLGGIFAYGINNHDQIVGSTSAGEAVLFDHGVVTQLGSLGAQGGNANGINDHGQITGASPTGTGIGGAFLYSSGHMISLGTTSSDLPLSLAFGLNNFGDVVGEVYNNSTDIYHAFVYHSGQMLDLNDLIPSGGLFTLTDAQAINDQGQIVVNGNDGGQNRAFLLTPVPEPASMLLSVFAPACLHYSLRGRHTKSRK